MTRFVLFLAALMIAALFPAEAWALSTTGARSLDIPAWSYYLGAAAVGTTVLASTSMTLVDYAKLLDPNDQVARIINMLAKKNEMLIDMPFMEGTSSPDTGSHS